MGMSFMLSPGVTVREWDLTQIVPQVAVSGGGIVGQFAWGPLEKISVISSEERLVSMYGLPDDVNFGYWFCAKNFLDYSRNLKVLRVIGAGAQNSYDNTATPASTVVIKNINDWQDNNSVPSTNDWGQFAGRYPGIVADGIEIHMADAATFSAVQTIEITDPGSGYTTLADHGRAVTISAPLDGGTQATGTLNVVADVVTGVTITNKGLGYRNPPTVTIPAPLAAVGTQAVGTISFTGETVDDIVITNGGTGYDGTEGITFAAPTKVNSTATVTISQTLGVIDAVTLVSGGYGYSTGTISIPGGGGDATVDITVVAGVITAAVLNAPGTGYSNGVAPLAAPTNTVTTATATLTIVAGVVTDVVFVSHGYGYAGTESFTIAAPIVTNDDTATAESNLWMYYDQFLTIPETTEYVRKKNGSNDGLHIVVIDGAGAMTGDKGRILERYSFCSKAKDATYDDGTSSYYPYVLRDRSAYVWFGDFPATMDIGIGGWGNTAQDRTFNSLLLPVAVTLANGSNGANIANAQLVQGWNEFKNVEEIDVGLLISGPVDRVIQDHIIQNVAEYRKDCVAFISPEALVSGGVGTGVIYNKGFELEALRKQRNVLPSSSYGVLDCNWKYQFDAYNDTFRWIPLCGDIAGLCARTDETRDPWWSPAGFNRGHIKNCVKLAWNPNRTDRDEMYPNSINPVVTMQGEGTLLYGDRTMLTQPSAFDRINVRRLFIVLEKAIAKAAKYQLFEFNDEFTRLRFIQMVEPYLRDVKGRRGIYDFKVVCDETNNTPFVIDNNAFVGDIYIKPARSINFITLNFVATGTGVVFDEIIGQFG